MGIKRSPSEEPEIFKNTYQDIAKSNEKKSRQSPNAPWTDREWKLLCQLKEQGLSWASVSPPQIILMQAQLQNISLIVLLLGLANIT
jgi:hypothetical protein